MNHPHSSAWEASWLAPELELIGERIDGLAPRLESSQRRAADALPRVLAAIEEVAWIAPVERYGSLTVREAVLAVAAESALAAVGQRPDRAASIAHAVAAEECRRRPKDLLPRRPESGRWADLFVPEALDLLAIALAREHGVRCLRTCEELIALCLRVGFAIRLELTLELELGS